MLKAISLVSLLICFMASVHGQSTVTGRVYDEKGEVVPYAIIKVNNAINTQTSDEDGVFTLQNLTKGDIVEFSYLGKKKYQHTFDGKTVSWTILMQDNTLALEEVEVNPTIGKGQSNSSLFIDREMIERYPSLSLNDLLNYLPNRRVVAPSLQNLQTATFRGAFQTMTNNGRNVHEMNNSFGIAVIVDDIALGNNANMQSRNVGIRGLQNASLGVLPHEYGLSGGSRTATGYSGETAFTGVDLRQIPTENIESIEVITGVPSVRHGDLTGGAVIVERQAGKAPAYFRVQLRNNATSYSYSDGLSLGNKWGHINTSINYANSFADNRDKIKQYSRINGSLIWTTKLAERWKNTFSTSYGKHIDGVRKDEDDPMSTIVKYDNWNFQASNRLRYDVGRDFLKYINFNVSLSTSHQNSYREYYYNDAYVLYTDATQTGIVEGLYETGQYTAIDHIDGRPLNFTSRMEGFANWFTGDIMHTLNGGFSFDYSTNKGKGRLADPQRPNKGLGGAFSERYYDFSLLHPVTNMGAYIEDAFRVMVQDRPLRVRAGVRWDMQNGHSSISPRTNLNYQLSEELNLGLAYGLGFKAPSLAHLYPGPVFSDIILLNAYNGKVNESQALIYVERYDPQSDHLRASKSQTMEFSARWSRNNNSLFVNVFDRKYSDGVGSSTTIQNVFLPQYRAESRPGQKPIVHEIGERRYETRYSVMGNILSSRNSGVEVMYSSPKIDWLYTSFNLSAGYYRSLSFSDHIQIVDIENTDTDPGAVMRGYYKPMKNLSYLSNGKVSSSTHVPKLKLIVEMIADFQFFDYSVNSKDANFEPVGYTTRDLTYHAIERYDPNNEIHRMLFEDRKRRWSDAGIERNYFKANFHMSMAKEITKKLRFSFNVYNFLDYQPRIYKEQLASVLVPNTTPSYGAEISYKF